MSMEVKSNWSIAFGAAGVAGIVAAVVGAGSVAHDQPSVWSAPWFLTVTSAGALFVLIASLVHRSARQEQPRLVFGEPVVTLRGINVSPPTGGYTPLRLDEVKFGTGATAPIVGTYATTHIGPSHITALFAYVPVENRPTRGGTDAANVKARLRFSDSAGNVITEMHGRWADTDMEGRRDTILRAPEVPLRANGNPRLLDIALKYLEDDQCYAMNDENVFYPMLRYRPLGPRLVRVEIEVRGSGGCRAQEEFDLVPEGGRDAATTLATRTG